MKRTLLAVVLLIARAALAGPVNEKMLVSTEWLAKNLGRVTVVHVGTAQNFASEHIPGAHFLDTTSLVAKRNGVPNELPQLDQLQKTMESLGIGNRRRIVIYGDEPLLAARLFWTLDYLGQGKRIAILDGGLAKWKADLRPVAQGQPNQKSRPFTARVEQERVVFLTQLAKLKDTPIVDARPIEQFTGAEPGEGVTRPGHIPGAVSLFWRETLASDGTLRPAAELKKLHEDSGIAPGHAVTYCRTGMQASWSYFVLRYLGYEPALYDGSFVEWSADPGTEVEK